MAYFAGLPVLRSRSSHAATGSHSHTGPIASSTVGAGKSACRVRHARTVPTLTSARFAISFWPTKSDGIHNPRSVSASPRAGCFVGVPMPLLVCGLGVCDGFSDCLSDALLFRVAHVGEYTTLRGKCQGVIYT